MKKKILCLAITLIMVVGASLTVQAEDFEGSKAWLVDFNGDEMISNFVSEELADDMKNVQPGDSITFQVKISNSSKETTDWYMTNEVLQTLEDSNDTAEGGAYTYVLTYSNEKGEEKLLYSSEIVGGEEDITKEGEGLHQATNSLEDYFYLDTLKAGETGLVQLLVEVEGETTGIDYQITLAKLKMNFAVEKEQGKIFVETGDTARLMLYSSALLLSGIVLLALAIKSSRRYGKGA